MNRSLKYGTPSAAISAVRDAIDDARLTQEIYDAEIVPALDDLVRLHTTYTLQSTLDIQFTVDWEKFDEIVDRVKPLDMHTLRKVEAELFSIQGSMNTSRSFTDALVAVQALIENAKQD